MFKAIGISRNEKEVVLYLTEQYPKQGPVLLAFSPDGNFFKPLKKLLTIRPSTGQKISPGFFEAIRATSSGTGHIITFLKTIRRNSQLYLAEAKKTNYWSKAKRVTGITQAAAVAVLKKNKRALYFGDHKIFLALSATRGTWDHTAKAILNPRADYFDNSGLTVGHVRILEQGILLTYYARYSDTSHRDLVTVGAALLDMDDPAKILWRSDYPLWQQPKGYRGIRMDAVGEIDFAGQSRLYLQNEEGKIFFAVLPLWKVPSRLGTRRPGRPHLERALKNPVLSPRPEHDWESKATFNPAAFYAKGRVHLIYRAIGNDDISTFGYASSPDGLQFDERLDYPIYGPRKNFEGKSLSRPQTPSAFASGGSGIGGCEDPRVSLIKDTLYMTYVAFDGCNPPRVALTSIGLEDFLGHRWNWKEPVLISPYISGQGNKNACVLPEKINGQYVIFHRIWPDILIDYVDELNFDGQQKFLSRAGHAKIRPRKLHWDSKKIGVGATPLKTPVGWLLIYQAVGNQDGSKYKIGAMLLDLQNPSHVLARAHVPVLEPEAWYENEGWKYGVVYPCGAAAVGDDLLVYYGGADMYTCVAKASLSDFLNHLLTHQPATLSPVEM